MIASEKVIETKQSKKIKSELQNTCLTGVQQSLHYQMDFAKVMGSKETLNPFSQDNLVPLYH